MEAAHEPLPLRAVRKRAPESAANGTPPLRTLHQAAARWIGALIRMTSPHPAMTAALDVVERLQERPYRTSFVLLGEPGTGKVGLARALHQLTCPDGPLVRFDVVGFTDEDALAVLTGDGKRRGAGEAAAGGTLLIGETSGLGPRTQAALIRLLKTGRVAPALRGRRAGHPQARLRDRDVRPRPVGRGAGGPIPTRPLLAARAHRPQAAAAARAQAGHRSGGDLDGQPDPARRRSGPRARDERRPRAACRSTSARSAIELKRDAIAALEELEWQGNLRELETVLERALLLYRARDALDAKAVRAAR